MWKATWTLQTRRATACSAVALRRRTPSVELSPVTGVGLMRSSRVEPEPLAGLAIEFVASTTWPAELQTAAVRWPHEVVADIERALNTNIRWLTAKQESKGEAAVKKLELMCVARRIRTRVVA